MTDILLDSNWEYEKINHRGNILVQKNPDKSAT